MIPAISRSMYIQKLTKGNQIEIISGTIETGI